MPLIIDIPVVIINIQNFFKKIPSNGKISALKLIFSAICTDFEAKFIGQAMRKYTARH